MVTLTDEQKQQMVDAAIEQIKAKAITEATHYLAENVRQSVAHVLWEEVRKVVEEEVVPAVREELVGQKATLIRGAVEAADRASTAVGDAIVKEITDRLADTWKRGEIMKALFSR